MFRENSRHPSLSFKKVHNTEPIYAVRTHIHYRAVGVVDSGDIVWIWIGPHTQYDAVA